MALISQNLATQLQAAFAAAAVDISPTAEKTLANAIAAAIHSYIITAQVDTVDTGIAVGGVNSSTVVSGGGPIITPANVTGTGVGKLS